MRLSLRQRAVWSQGAEKAERADGTIIRSSWVPGWLGDNGGPSLGLNRCLFFAKCSHSALSVGPPSCWKGNLLTPPCGSSLPHPADCSYPTLRLVLTPPCGSSLSHSAARPYPSLGLRRLAPERGSCSPGSNTGPSRCFHCTGVGSGPLPTPASLLAQDRHHKSITTLSPPSSHLGILLNTALRAVSANRSGQTPDGTCLPLPTPHPTLSSTSCPRRHAPRASGKGLRSQCSLAAHPPTGFKWAPNGTRCTCIGEQAQKGGLTPLRQSHRCTEAPSD